MNKKKSGVEVHFSDKIQTHETFSCEVNKPSCYLKLKSEIFFPQKGLLFFYLVFYLTLKEHILSDLSIT